MHCAIGNVLVALFGAWQFHSMCATHKPPVHHRMRYFGVELKGVTGAMAECLY